MNMLKFALLPTLAAASALQAADIFVSEEMKLQVTSGDRLIPAALRQDGTSLPISVAPIFHLDAANREGWEFSDDDKTLITKVPSLTGSRYLTTDKTGGSWNRVGWPISPVLVAADPSLGGRPCIDFGKAGSKRGLLFNAVADATTGNVASNTLNGIGTVFWVIDSSQGGGSLMGGGYGLNNGGMNNGNMWLRGLSAYYSGAWNYSDPWSPLFRYYDGAIDDAGNRNAAKGVFYHNGIAASPMRLGMTGGWEVISLQPEELGLTATGLGLGTVGRNPQGDTCSGAQRIAELIVYGEKLSDADRERVEVYLRKKWFGEDLRGWNDNAVVDFVRASKNVAESYLSNGAEIEVAPAAGETLNIGRLMGGRGGYASFNLKGEGTLSIADATSYQGSIRLHKGRLSFDKRPIPLSLPAGIVAHFDASDASSYVTETDENGLARIVRWDSLSDFTYNGHRLCLAPNPDSKNQVPWLCENAMPGGKAAVDFGHKRQSGPNLLLYGTNSLSTAVALAGISTVIAVMSPHSGATGLVGAHDKADPAAANALSYFNPSGHDRDWYSPIFSSAVLTKVNPKLSGASDNIAYVDGIRHDHTSGYPHPAWQVVAFEGAGSKFAALGLTGNHYYAGGAMRLAEIVIYTRPLSEQELKDASAYLSAKWFRKETPGYARTIERSRIDDVSVLEVAGPAEIYVAGGTTLRVGKLICDGSLSKTGDGVLEVVKSVNSSVNLKVKEGAVVHAEASAPENSCSPASEPSAHFDASDLSTLMFNPTSGLDKEYVWTWYDKNGRNSAYWKSATQSINQPWLNRTDTLSSLPVIDFGPNGSYRYLQFAKPLDGVKAAFVVWGSQEGGGCLLGNVDVHGFANDQLNDFRRLDKATVDTLIFNEANFTQHVWDGVIYTNGCLSSNKAKPSGDWDLIEVYPKGAAHVSAFAFERKGANTGGQRLAEVILYERTLTEREKVATRNYLMKKWFGAEPQPLPEEDGGEDVGFGSLEVDGQSSLEVASSASIGELRGSGTITKAGEGTLSIERFDAFTGMVEVASGSLNLLGRLPNGVEPALETDGLIARFDASYGVIVGSDPRGRTTLEEWASAVGNLRAVPDRFGMSPIYSIGGLNGLPTVKMDDRTYNCWQLLRFVDSDGTFVHLENIRSVFWVIGSQEGGGYLLGGGVKPAAATPSERYNFHRGGATAGRVAEDAILSGAAQAEVQAANWRLNGRKITPTIKGLSGKWDIVSMTMKETAANPTRVEGFAFDGRFRPHEEQYSYGDRSSGQRLAEVLFYDRVLDENEIIATQEYLSQKWGVAQSVASATNSLSVALAPGAMLEMGEQTHLAGLSGQGGIIGDVTAFSLAADFASTGSLVVDGVFTLPQGVKVELSNLPQVDSGAKTRVKILEADRIAGSEFAETAVFSGENGCEAKLRVLGNSLWCVLPRGLTVIVR